MSKTDSPASIAFDIQRSAIEQTHQAVSRGVETQRGFNEALVDFGAAKQANERSYDALRTVVDVYFDALETAMPGQQDALGEFRDAVDEQFDALEADQTEAIETLEANVREGSESADDLLEEFVAVLDEQFEAVLDAQADIEDQTVEAVEGFEGNLEELRTEFEAQLEQFEEQAAEMADTPDQQGEAAGESLEAIDGIGPTYADRLHDQGIESLDALGETAVDTVALAADVSEAQAEEWIDAAQLRA